MGPPVCDELVALVEHLFTEEEASVVRHLGLLSGRTAAELARAEHRPPRRDRAHSRSAQPTETHHRPQRPRPGHDYRYRLLPIVPGIFEMMLISHTPESLTDWHRRFIELFEALYETGYSLDYKDHPVPAVRYLPVGKTIDAHPMALPSDKLEVVFDQFDVFGIGQCQCRMAMQVIGQGCGKPLGNCTVMGQWAEQGIAEGMAPPGLEEGSPGDQARGRIARHGQLDDERPLDPRPMLLLVLRLLLSRHAGRQRVQRAGVHCSAPFLAAARCVEVHLLRQVCPGLPDGGDRRGHTAEDAAASPRALHRLRTVRLGV